MSSDPYAAPTANLENVSDAPVVQPKIFSAKGRLSVVSYWGQFFLIFLVTYCILAILVYLIYKVGDRSVTDLFSFLPIVLTNPIATVLGGIGVVVYLASFVAFVLLMIKRLHDRNHSGWWLLGLYAVLFLIGWFVPTIAIIPLLGFLYIVFFPGQKAGNRFGGHRATKGWEKILCIVFVLLIAVGIVALITTGADLAQIAG